MPYFLSETNLIIGQVNEVSGEEVRHILLAHRAKKGERIKLQGPDGKRFLSEIISTAKNSLSINPFDEIQVPAEPKISTTLFQSIVNEKALDFIFQKGTELGLNKIVLFNSANAAKKLSPDEFKKKQVRWQKILIEAAKQSERAVWPSLEFSADVLSGLASFDMVYLADIDGGGLKSISDDAKNIAIIIGPEGGFTVEEINKFNNQPKIKAITLGPILLRAETAALSMLSLLRAQTL